MLVRKCRAGSLGIVAGNGDWCRCLEKHMLAPQDVNESDSHMTQYFLCLAYISQIENMLYKCLLLNACGGIVHNCATK